MKDFRTAVCLIIVLFSLSFIAVGAPSPTAERHTSFNRGWLFLKGDAAGAEQPGFSDTRWRKLDLPHDWAIEGPFDRQINPHTGALPIYGTGWYRKHFLLPASADGRYFSIEFDGAMSNARVWLNGHELGGRPYGYIGFAFDLTPYLRFGAEENVLAVRLTPEKDSSRWYPGAGIYRNVWLEQTGAIHVARWGTYVTTPAVTEAEAKVAVQTQLRNRGTAAAKIRLRTSIVDAAGKKAATQEQDETLPAGETVTASTSLALAHPHRWDVDDAYLYSVVTEILDGRRVLDHYVTPLGVRTIAFDKAQGFLLNGRRLKMHGVCNHHDLGALGAAVNRRALERQLQIMKDMGVNAIRTSHNPPAPELLDLADSMGLLVMDEAFDMWQIAKVKNGYSKYFDEWSERDLRDQLRRDRNHPSVVLWSIGNEIPEQGKPDGWKVARRLTAICHEEDKTRPTTAAFNNPLGAIKNGMAAEVDVPGLNYKPWLYGEIHEQHPDWILVATETASCVSSRGVYHLPIDKYEKHPSLQLSSYDIIAPRWAYCPDVEFAAQDKFPNVLGEFVWTGFDYLGEPTPYFNKEATEQDWPSRSSYFGAVDLAGFPKDRFFLYQSVWTGKPMVHILPHWNWAGHEGQNIPVFAYSNAEEVELFLNGKSLGRKPRGGEAVEIPVGPNVSKDGKYQTKYRMQWQVPYQPGTLKAVAYRAGKIAAQDEVRTAGAPARITLIPDRKTIGADGDDLAFVTVRIEDKDGNPCPMGDNLVRFKVEGNGRIEAVDNGNAATTEPFQADYRKAFSGLALLIVRSSQGQPGSIQITATADGLQAGRTSVGTK